MGSRGFPRVRARVLACVPRGDTNGRAPARSRHQLSFLSIFFCLAFFRFFFLLSSAASSTHFQSEDSSRVNVIFLRLDLVCSRCGNRIISAVWWKLFWDSLRLPHYNSWFDIHLDKLRDFKSVNNSLRVEWLCKMLWSTLILMAPFYDHQLLGRKNNLLPSLHSPIWIQPFRLPFPRLPPPPPPPPPARLQSVLPIRAANYSIINPAGGSFWSASSGVPVPSLEGRSSGTLTGTTAI